MGAELGGAGRGRRVGCISEVNREHKSRSHRGQTFRRRERENKPAAFIRIDKHLLEDWEAALSWKSARRLWVRDFPGFPGPFPLGRLFSCFGPVPLPDGC